MRVTFPAIAAAGLMVGGLSSGANAANSFNGKGTFAGTLVTRPVIFTFNAVCTLQQSGNTVRGTCNGANGGGPASGIVNGNRIQLQVHITASNAAGLTVTNTFHGALGGDGAIRGTFTLPVSPGNTGTFNAVRV